ncbi:YciI family protein [Burkholderia sp. Ac-20344]|uniref:YciI family protein n=1 Tax=Burkholderia sp. Ac-20344 TaxID=2703890 RepID=UPI00197BA07C|nr:YciI family protein [Burkholderia sp. Ac-20344]MBN3832075.1 YciI family protein [Burkholderia sp. Ac-20344]
MARFFAVFATDQPGMRDVRDRVRPIHRSYLRSADQHGVVVRLGGPTLDPHGDAMNGTLLVVEADDIHAVMQFVGNDPYVKEGLFSHVEVRPWDWSLGNPEQRV